MSKLFEAVFSPHKFEPSIIKNNMDFEQLWKTNQDFVFSSLSHIAYFNQLKVKAFMKQLGANATYFYDVEGAQAFLSMWDDKAVLSFRGTQPIEGVGKHHRKLGFFRKLRLKYFWHLPLDPLSLIYLNNDLLADLKFIPTPFDDSDKVEVHSGFLSEINKIWSGIFTQIKQDIGELPIYVTGHSLGGAMATLAGMRYSFEKVTTFGEPRVGIHIDKAFKSNSHTRYVNGDDPVTTLPPELFYGYSHHGNPIHISDRNGETDLKYDHSIVYYSKNLS